MNLRTLGLAALAAMGLGIAVQVPPSAAADSDRVFELRTYTAAPGKLDTLQARFRDHTVALFEKHGPRLVDHPGGLIQGVVDLVDHGVFDFVVAQLGITQEGSLQSANPASGLGQFGGGGGGAALQYRRPDRGRGLAKRVVWLSDSLMESSDFLSSSITTEASAAVPMARI